MMYVHYLGKIDTSPQGFQSAERHAEKAKSVRISSAFLRRT